jgi:hypothetical protein
LREGNFLGSGCVDRSEGNLILGSDVKSARLLKIAADSVGLNAQLFLVDHSWDASTDVQ